MYHMNMLKRNNQIYFCLLFLIACISSPLFVAASENDFENAVDFSRNRKCCPKIPGPPACCGSFNNYASYQLMLLPNQKGHAFCAHKAIAFRREIVNKGFSIHSSAPYHSFDLEPGIYEITLGVSTESLANQIQLVVGSERFTFTPYAVASDFITYAKTIEIFSHKNVKVVTTKGLTFSSGNHTRLAAYINFIRLD